MSKLFATCIDPVGSAKTSCPIKLCRNDVGCNDFRGTAQLRTLNHVHSVPAATNHEYAFTRFDPCPVARSSDTCRYATGNETCEIERDIPVDNNNRSPIHNGAF